MMLLFIGIGLVIYTLFLSQPNVLNIVDSTTFGTISTSLGSPFLGSSDAPITILNLEIINDFEPKCPVLEIDFE